MKRNKILERYAPLIGEFVWHSKTIDPTIDEISELHYKSIERIIKEHSNSTTKLRILEIASYTHWTGYKLAQNYDSEVYLYDISASTLKLGEKIAIEKGFDKTKVNICAGDFHNLPFKDEYFDVVYICSALHYTWDYKDVIHEMYRVTKENGLVYFENEPTQREFCFYNFRTNRLHDLTDFEKKCNELEILRTLAEPFLGSRPESLFCMIENQNIKLEDFLLENAKYSKRLELHLYPQTCMSSTEYEIVKQRRLGKEKVKEIMYSNYFSKFEEAFKYYAEVDKAIGIVLPSLEEIEEMADNISKKITCLPENHLSLEYKIAESKIFGAPITFLSRKKKSTHINKNKKSDIQTIVKEGISYCFAEEISSFLIQNNSIIPNLDFCNENKLLKDNFLAEYWRVIKDINAEKLIFVPTKLETKIKLPLMKTKDRLLILRVNVAKNESPYKITIMNGKRIIWEYEIYKDDSFLLTEVFLLNSTVLQSEYLDLKLSCNNDISSEKFNISYIGIFDV